MKGNYTVQSPVPGCMGPAHLKKKKNVENNHQRIQLSNCRIINSFMESSVVHLTWLDCDLLVLFSVFLFFLVDSLGFGGLERF